MNQENKTIDLENCKQIKKQFLSTINNTFTNEEDLNAFNNLKESLRKCIGCMGCFTKDELIELNSCGDADVEKFSEAELKREYC